jgi:hypothetical protein
MDRSAVAQKDEKNTERHSAGSWVRTAIRALDAHLRHRQGVYEYTNLRECVFRAQLIENQTELMLSDGTRLRCGEPIIDLHLWNEQVPRMPPGGPNLAWARRLDRCVDLSLRELATHLADRPDLDAVRAIRGNMSLGADERAAQMARVAARFGFEQLPAPAPTSIGEHLHWFGENILISMLVLAQNSSTLRTDTLLRCRTLTFLPRRTLERRFGGRA